MMRDAEARRPSRVVVIGPAGCGKSTVGQGLAVATGYRFVDGDDLHSAASRSKIAAGRPLDEGDRRPWLAAVARLLELEPRIVVACSALRRRHRDVLRGPGDVAMVLLDVSPAVAQERVASRHGHFMGPGLVRNQYDTLERPTPDETDVIVVDASQPPDAVVRSTLLVLDQWPVDADGISQDRPAPRRESWRRVADTSAKEP